MMTSPFDLQQRTAMVTGGGRGIGRAISLALAAAGANVVVTDLAERLDLAQSVADQISRSGRRAEAYVLDVREEGDCRIVIDRVVDEFGAIDILVNNAGIKIAKSAFETTREDFELTFSVNVLGAFACAAAAAQHMVKGGGGTIVNIASQLAVVGAVNRAAYVSSKGALLGLTRALAVEWAPFGIRVNAVGPGPTETALWNDEPSTSDDREMLVAKFSPIGRVLSPEEIAGAVVYLAAPAAAAVTGQLLIVDGGWTAW